jgi:hypothetical protein
VTPSCTAVPRGFGTAARAVLALVVATLCGCPFTSDKPLSDPAAAVPDSRLLGTWKTQDPETGEWNSLTILAFNEHEMVGFAREKDPDKVDAFRLFLTSIGSDRFLSFQELGGRDAGWYYARYDVAQDRLRLKIVDDGLFADRQFGSSRELWEFFRQHLADPLLYSAADDKPSETVWERVPEPSGSLKSES